MNTEKRPNLFVLIPVAFVAFAVLCGLGAWQVQRMEWKQDIIAQIDARITRQPLPLEVATRIFRETGDAEYTVVTARGHFDPNQERHFYSTHDGMVGWEIFAPFITNNQTLLVNRGFIPAELKQSKARPDDQVRPPGQSDTEIVGLLRKGGKQDLFVPDNDETADIWYWRDLQGMSLSLGISQSEMLPFYLDLISPTPPGGLPKPGITRLDIPNKHLGYAITWFGLAGALVVIVGLFIRRSRGNADEFS